MPCFCGEGGSAICLSLYLIASIDIRGQLKCTVQCTRQQQGLARNQPTESSKDGTSAVYCSNPPCSILRLPLLHMLPESMHGGGGQNLAVASCNEAGRGCKVPMAHPCLECLLTQPAHAQAICLTFVILCSLWNGSAMPQEQFYKYLKKKHHLRSFCDGWQPCVVGDAYHAVQMVF